jgi:peroxiredoxin
MEASLWLLSWLLAPGQMATRPLPVAPAPAVRGVDPVLLPRLTRSQELVYRGTFSEESTGPRVQYTRRYKVELRLFVLETPAKSAEVALLDTLQSDFPRAEHPSRVPPVTSIRLERLTVDLRGKVSAEAGVSLSVPHDGVPTLECGMFLEVPVGRSGLGQTWEEVEAGRPLRSWKVVGTETINATSCLKLVGEQKSEDWDRPRADHTAWRRVDTVWIAPRNGLASRVERTIEQREPAHREPTQRSTLRYDLESTLQYPGSFSEDRRQEILQTLNLRASAAPWLAAPAKGEKALSALARKVEVHLENQPPTPYRPALLHLKRQIDAARRGEVIERTPAVPETRPAAPAVAVVGQPAPDFLANEITAAGTARLARWHGRPILLVFYNPASPRAAELLQFCQTLHHSHGKYVAVVGLSVSEDVKAVLQQRAELKCTFPVFHGGGLRRSYGVETTPKLVLIDAAGFVRGDYLGWGRETAGEVLAELRNWLPR